MTARRCGRLLRLARQPDGQPGSWPQKTLAGGEPLWASPRCGSIPAMARSVVDGWGLAAGGGRTAPTSGYTARHGPAPARRLPPPPCSARGAQFFFFFYALETAANRPSHSSHDRLLQRLKTFGNGEGELVSSLVYPKARSECGPPTAGWWPSGRSRAAPASRKFIRGSRLVRATGSRTVPDALRARRCGGCSCWMPPPEPLPYLLPEADCRLDVLLRKTPT